MEIIVNGKSRDVQSSLSLADLLDVLAMRPEMVHVQVNGEMVPRENLAAVTLQEKDEVDIVMAMGGGRL